jgi:outer membrane protein W
MKRIILSLALTVATLSFYAQEDMAFTKSSSTVSLGYGFASPYKTLFKLSNAFGTTGVTTKLTSLGPIALTYEYGVTEKISAGLTLGYGGIKNVTTEKDGISAGKDYIQTEELNQISAVLRGNYHFGKSPKFDPYVGLGLGFYNFKYEVSDNDNTANTFPVFSTPSAFGVTGQLGAKYYFTSSIGAYAEVGYLAGSFVQLGLTAKF